MSDALDDVIASINEGSGHAFRLDNAVVTDRPVLLGFHCGVKGIELPTWQEPDLKPHEISCPACGKWADKVCEERGAAVDYHLERWLHAFVSDIKVFFHDDEQLEARINIYAEGKRVRLDIVDEDGAPFACLTKNDPEFPLEVGEFLVKDFDENKGVARSCAPLFTDTGKRHACGFYTLKVWRWKI